MIFNDVIKGRSRNGLSHAAVSASFKRAQDEFGIRRFGVSRVIREGQEYTIVYASKARQITEDQLRDKVKV